MCRWFVLGVSTRSTDSARDVVDAAQILLTGTQDDACSICQPWGMQLRSQKRSRAMEIIKQELIRASTKRALKLKSETEAAAGSAATDHAETEVRADDALSETHTGLVQAAAESTATEHAGAECCVEAALAEPLSSHQGYPRRLRNARENR